MILKKPDKVGIDPKNGIEWITKEVLNDIILKIEKKEQESRTILQLEYTKKGKIRKRKVFKDLPIERQKKNHQN